MKVKVSDIMLDLNTGDASVHDAFIQEAFSQVNVSSKMYDMAESTFYLDDAERQRVIQEGVLQEAGYPTDKEGALELVYESVEHELTGLAHQLYTEMCKIHERATKPTSPYGAMNALAKSLGCPMTLDGSLEYAMEYAKAVSEGKKSVKLKPGTRYLKGKSAVNKTKNLIQGVCILANALGFDTKKFLNSKAIKAVLPDGLTTDVGKDEDGKPCCSLAHCSAACKTAGSFLKKAKFGENDFTTNPSQDDIAKVEACDTAVSNLADFIKGKLDEDGKNVDARIKKACKNNCNKKKIPDAAKDLNEKSETGTAKIVEVAKGLREACADFVEEFNNCAAAIIETKTED